MVMTATQRQRARDDARAAIERVRDTSIAELWQQWTEDMPFADMQPRALAQLRVAFVEGASRVAENVATVAENTRQRALIDMAQRLIAEAWTFEDSTEARSAFAPGGSE